MLNMRKLAFPLFIFFLTSNQANAGVTFSPFVGISSKKKIKSQGDGTEKEEVVQTKTYGVRATLGIYRIVKFELGLGQTKVTTTDTVSTAKDEFGDIDYQQDANVSTENPDAELKTTETRNRGRISLVLDPGFWIFIARAKVGVQVTQRLLTIEEAGKEKVELKPDPTYKPFAAAGLGVRIGRTMQAMAEYSFYFYKYPELEPFDREVSISYGISI